MSAAQGWLNERVPQMSDVQLRIEITILRLHRVMQNISLV